MPVNIQCGIFQDWVEMGGNTPSASSQMGWDVLHTHAHAHADRAGLSEELSRLKA